MSVADYSTPALQLPTPTGPASPSAHSLADPLNPLPVLPHIDPSLPVRPHQHPYPTAQNAELMKDLRLAELKIQRLELEAETAKRMLDQERLLRARLNEIDEEAKSIASEPLTLPTDFPDQRMKAVGAYVASIPKNPPSVSFPGPYVRPTPPTDDVSRLAETAQLLRACMNTPVRKSPKFDGNPRYYHGFIRGFASAVERYLTDPTDLLDHLIECCEGEAADAIRRCTILDPRVGYAEARRILERRFGEPHVIARQCIEELTGGQPLKPNDCQALVKLADSMKLCSATLKHLRYEADLNATKTLRSIVQRLPGHLQTRWCDVAAHIFKEGREPTFDELADFVDDRADAATTRQVYLGEATHEPRHSERVGVQTSNRIPQSNPGLPTQKVCTLATTSNIESTGSVSATTSRPYPVCPKCGHWHYLDQCQEFLKLSPKDRAQFIKTSKLCELCLKPNHRPDTCKSWRRFCTFEQCREQHHPLLHCEDLPWVPDDTSASADMDPRKVTINTSTTGSSPVALGILPVRIRGPHGCCTTLALLDSGSDSTLVETQLAARLGLAGSRSNISIGTLHGRTPVASRRVHIEVVTQNPTASVERIQAWSVPKLPAVHQVHPSRNEVNQWPHLADIPFQSLQGRRVELLIGMDNPSMHWVLESKVGMPMDPYGVRTPLGWVLLGPLRSGPVSEVRINHISGGAEVQLASRPVKDTHLHRICTDAARGKIGRGYVGPTTKFACIEQPTTSYLPRHPETHPQKPDKVRMVVDFESQFPGQASNNQLSAGPDKVDSRSVVLLPLYQTPHVFAADVEATLRQVELPEVDRIYLRFLWRRIFIICTSYALEKPLKDRRPLFDNSYPTRIDGLQTPLLRIQTIRHRGVRHSYLLAAPRRPHVRSS